MLSRHCNANGQEKLSTYVKIKIKSCFLMHLIMGVPNSLITRATLIESRAVASAPDPRPGRKGSICFVRAGGGNGPGERRRKGGRAAD